MDYNDFERRINEAEGNYTRQYTAPSMTFPVLMRKVYTWMTLALVITGITAYGVAHSPNLLYALYSNSWAMWALIIAEFAVVIGLVGKIRSMSTTTATLLFILYSILNGAMLSSVCILYTMQSIGQVFFITAGTFGAMAIVGYTTKKDLTGMGKILMMALIGIIIATVVNIFVASSGLQMIISYVGVLIFVGLTAYDSQKIKQLLYNQDANDAGAQNLAVLGALTLYLDFINLFIYLLRIFGDRRS